MCSTPNSPDFASFNGRLAAACQACGAACCKKGKIFLTAPEVAAIRAYLAGGDPARAAEWEARLEQHDSFWLYDQKERCQFLTDENLCTLHPLGIKPNECFWWPYHVYAQPDGDLVIQVSTTCCDAWKEHDDAAAARFLEAIDEQVNAVGADVIRKFRQAYDGSYQRQPVRPVRLLR